MTLKTSIAGPVWLAGASVAAILASASGALAGGFDIHEQSTVFMGMTTAGAAAGGPISSMYWNPAAAAGAPGLNTESSYTLVLPNANAHVDSYTFGGPNIPVAPNDPNGNSGNVGIDAVTSASYGTYQIGKDLWVGMGINSPFGLATKPENRDYYGNALGLTTKLLTVNATPTLAYRIAPGVTIGAGIQIEYAHATLQFAEGFSPGPGAPLTAEFKGTDWAVGGTAGILIEPRAGTSIGIGYRSGLDHDLGGHLVQPFIIPGKYGAVGSISLPDIVTASFRQVITPTTRLLGTVEWTNWSRFKSLDLTSPGVLPGGAVSVPANWDDGWFFSLGGEYDYSPFLTLRAGVAYEISPEQDADQRFTVIPDNNRVWLSVGASYQWSASTTLDIGYSHIFVKDGDFTRTAVGAPVIESGTITDASADLISVGMRTRW